MSDLFDAIKAGDADAVGRLLDSDRSLLDAAENNVSAPMFALYHGKGDVARLFVDRGKKLTFHEACALGEAAVVRRMLDADPSLLASRSPDGYPAAGLPIFFRQPEVARLLIERGADVNAHADNAQRVAPVHAAAAVCDHGTMRLLLAKGADPNARQQMDYTAMHGAASRGDVEMAKLLLAAGADPRSRATDGMTPADVAVKHGHAGFAEWLRGVT
jgi:ankyrin repeat protein